MSQVDQRLVEFVKQQRPENRRQILDWLTLFASGEAKTPQVNAVGMPVLPGDADYERCSTRIAYQRELAATYDNPFEGTPGQILTRFKDAAATGFKGVVAAYQTRRSVLDFAGVVR